MGYLPYSQHVASSRNAFDAVNHYRRMYERPQYPFGSSYQSERPAPSYGGGVFGSRSGLYGSDASAGLYGSDRSAGLFGNERSSAISFPTPLGESPDRMSASPMERIVNAGGNVTTGAAGTPPESNRRFWDEGQWDRVTMTRPFLEAIDKNDVATVKMIISEHKRLTQCRIDPIHYAILKGHFQLIPILIEAGCNPDNVDMIGCTPLMNAVKGKIYEVVDLLLEGGADPNKPSGRKQEIPLIEAVYQNDGRLIKKLLARDNLEVNQTNDAGYDGETALTTAIFLGRVDLVDLLLQHGADPNEGHDVAKPTPLHIGVTAGAEQDCDDSVPLHVCELLLAFGAYPDSQDQNGFSPLHIAALNDRDDILDMLLNADNDGHVADIDAKSEGGETPLTVAVLHGSDRCAAKLLSAGCDFISEDDTTGSPGSAMLSKAFHLGYFTIVKMLLVVGAKNRNKRMFVRMPRTNLGTGFNLLNRLQQYQSLLLFLERRERCPPSLLHHSMLSIRRSIRPPLATSIQGLPLPSKITESLLLVDELASQMELEPMGHSNQEAED